MPVLRKRTWLVPCWCAALLMLTACVPGVGDLFDSLTGKDAELRKLREQPLLLTSTLRFDLQEPTQLAGSNAGVCLVLAHEVQVSDIARLSAEYLQGARLQAELVTEAGQRVALPGMSPTWLSRGILGRRHELSLCLRPCDALPAAGTRIRQISIATSKPVHTLGMYWHSAPTLKERQLRKAGPRADGSPLEPMTQPNGCAAPAA